MICCDTCEEWFHGSCVQITKAMNKEMEAKKQEWICPPCKEKVSISFINQSRILDNRPARHRAI